jgi:hypothetical protein
MSLCRHLVIIVIFIILVIIERFRCGQSLNKRLGLCFLVPGTNWIEFEYGVTFAERSSESASNFLLMLRKKNKK